MRRRSERKKSTDYNSLAPTASRRSRRSRASESEKHVEDSSENNNTEKVENEINEDNGNARASSEEIVEKTSRRGGRNARRRSPIRERSSPAKRKNQRGVSPETKIDSIPEEENGSDGKEDENISGNNNNNRDGTSFKGFDVETDQKDPPMEECANNVEGSADDQMTRNEDRDRDRDRDREQQADNIEGSAKIKVNSNSSISPKTDDKLKRLDVLELQDESQEGRDLDEEGTKSVSPAALIAPQNADTDTNDNDVVHDDNDVEDQESGDQAKMQKSPVIMMIEESREVQDLTENAQDDFQKKKIYEEQEKEISSIENSFGKHNESNKQINNDKQNEIKMKIIVQSSETSLSEKKTNERTRKRKWITKKTIENKKPILAISSDSLKNLIADVHPVPLSDIHLESSSEAEEINSDREEGEKTPSPEGIERRRSSLDKLVAEKPIIRRVIKDNKEPAVIVVPSKVPEHVQRSPSPPRNQSSCVLYITNLVRPFTVLQLKGLLARTGKITEDGFWIDRIKSKCFVEYETEDEAIETRHALHGVRWPVSNPKYLNVDFGRKADMQRAVESTKDEGPKLGIDNKDNLIVGTGWSRNEEFKKITRPVREWDVGKKESPVREVRRDKERDRRQVSKERERERDRERERERERERRPSRERENEKIERRNRENHDRSRTNSPVRKIQKKENQPPLRLLDDLFRKTKATPCIYWLPLTPEQIAEKEAFRQKRVAEHKERVKARELEREKEREREKEKDREREKYRERDRDRRNRSNDRDRRRSRSRERRRY